MKKDIHPENYRLVIFKDESNGERFLVGSTVASEATIIAFPSDVVNSSDTTIKKIQVKINLVGL